ncbi:MAG: hypothetical protein LBN25_00345 [Christensenellaceae bacterium]|nr:hypothetical protein [Christensenellaceae bacterium]
MIVATYIIPSVSTSEREVRVYFKKGDGEVTSPYVVIAPTEGYTPKAAGVNERLIGIYSRNAFGLPDLTPGIFNWRYTSATVTNTEAAAKPLRDGLYATDTDTALFGDRELGYQTVSLVVDVPSRRLPGGTTRTNVITNITTVGEIDNEILNSVTPSYVRFPGGAYGEGISLSPQDVGNGAVLPQTVTARYVGSGGGDAVDKTYTITWNASFFNDADGVFIKRIAREALVRVTGTIGDGTVKETVTLIVENGNKTFASLKAYGSFDPVEETRFEFETARLSDGNYSLNLDPYRYDYLPQTLEINFGTFSETFNFTNADWYYLYEGEYAKIEDVGGRGVFGWAVDGVTYYIRVQLEADPEARYLAQAVTFEIILSNREIKRDRIYGLLPNGAGWTQGIPFDGAAANAKAFENAILAAEYVEVEFATAARGKNVAVKWLNLEEVLEWLRSPQGTGFDGSDIIKKDLIGVVCEGIPSLEQQINISIQVIPRTINAISFGGISDVLINSGIIEYRGLEDYITNLNNGSSDSSIEIVVKKPYALINYLNYALDLGEFGLDISFEESYDGFLSLAFAQLLTDFSLVYRYQQFNLEPRLKPQLLYGLSYYAVDDLINMLLIEDSKTEHIRIATMGAGSMLMPIVFEYTVIRDAVITGGGDLIEYIDVLGADGSFMYPEKFEMPKTIAVMYQNSGIVSYDVRKWNLVLSVGEGMNQDDEIAEIGSEYYFEGGALLVGNKVLVRTNPLLHSSSEGNGNGYITLELRFYSKNIRNTNYKAAAPAAASLQYAISAGTITISNIYEIYPFNPDNVPRLITPVRNTQFYDFSGEGQTFDITKRWTTEDDETAVPHDWVWDAYFLTNGQFDPSKINAFGLARRRLATAIIEVAGVFQEIYLDIQVTAFTTDTVIDGEYVFDRSLEVQGRFTRELSMYSDGFGGNYILPQDITVRSGATQYTFRADDNRLKYYLDPSFAVINGQNIIKIIPYGWDGNYIPGTTYDEAGNISSISLAGSSGVSSAGIPLILELPDGILVNLLLTVKHEELQGVAYKNTVKDGQDAYFASPRNPNGALAVQQGTYYLDPYYSDSYVLPASVRAYFTGGAYLDLSVGTLKDGSGLDILQAGNILYNAETQQYSFTQEYVNWCIANANTEILYNASLSYYGGYPEKYQTYRMRVVIVDRGLRELESEVVNPLLVSREFLEKQATDYLHANFASLSAPEYSILNLAEISVSFDIQNSALLNETYGTFAGGAEREIFGRVTGTLKTSAVVENETVITSHVTEGIQIVKRISAKKLVFAGLTGIEENAQGVIINSEIPLDYHLTIDPYTANAIPNKYMVHFSDGSALSGIVAYTIPFASKAEADSYLIVNGEFTDEAIGYGYDKTDRLFIFLGSSSLTSEERYELGVIRDIKIGTGYNGDYSYACSGVGAVQITGGGTVVAGAGYVFYFTAIEVLEINIYPEYSALPGLDVPGVLVIDPLNPHIPTVVQAKVREVANIGTEIVSWTMLSVKFIPYEPFTPAIDDFTQLPTNSGAVTRRYIASLSGADQNSNAIIDDVLIDVIYLDRRYMQVYMPDFTIQDEYGMPDIRSYSTLSTYEQQFNNAEGKLLRKIYDRTSSVPWTFSLDPLRSYDYYTQKNIIPVSLTAAFRADYTDSGLNAEVIPLVNALVNDRYGYIADITDIDWGDLSERIRLFSTVQGEFYNINASFTRDFRISVKVDGVYGAPQRKKLDNNREFGYSNYTLIARVPVYELEIPFAGALQYNSQNEMFFAAYTQGVGYDDYTIDPYAYILHQNANHIYPYGDDLRSDRIKINLTRDITILYDITENGINDYLAFMRQPTNGSFAAEIAVRAVLRDAYKQYTGNLAISEAAFNALDLTNLAKEGFFAYLKAAFVPEKMLATYYIYYNAGYDSTDLNAAAARGSLSQKDKADIVKYKEFVLSEKARTERVRYAFDLYTRVFNDIREAAGKPLFAGDYVRLRDNINEAELTAFREYTRLYGDEISVNGGNSFFREVFDLGYFQIRYGVRGGLKTAINVGSSLLKDAPWVGSDRNMQGSATVLNGGAVMFYFEFFGTRVPILFQLKSSPISNLNIQGGDIYVLEGEDILPQLPKSILYSINGEMREVPVTFSGYDINGDYYASPEFSTVTGIDSDRRSGYPKVVASGTYNIRAMLGIFEKNNIYFNLVVIKPTLQNFLNNVVLTDGDFYTGGGGAYYTKFEKGAPDEEYLSGISLAILNGNYAQGAERAIFVKNAPIEGGFGDRLLYIEDFIIVKEGNDYFMDLYAFYDANLMGNPSVGTGNHDETRILCWRIPVATYVATMLYSGTVSIEQSQIESPLGAEINVSKLPKAKNSSGELFPLMWDLGTINTNRAGTYVARGWYVDNTGTNRSLALTIVVKRRLIALDLNEDGDYVDENEYNLISIDSDYTSRAYQVSEFDILPYITIAPLLRDSGAAINMPVSLLKIEYASRSVANGITEIGAYSVFAPTNAGLYSVRLTIDEYNYYGSVAFNYEITKKYINLGDGGIYMTFPANHIPAVIGSVNSANGVFQYGEAGHENIIGRDETVWIYFDGTGHADLEIVGVPHDAVDISYSPTFLSDQSTWFKDVRSDRYRITVSILSSSPNYTGSSIQALYYILIRMPEAEYSVSNVVYNGFAQKPKINGFDPDLEMTAEYVYWYENEITHIYERTEVDPTEAGTYLVQIHINGGTNMPSAYIPESANPSISGEDNEMSVSFTIEKKSIAIDLKTVRNDYFAAFTVGGVTNPLSDSLTRDSIIDAYSGQKVAITESDFQAILSGLRFYVTEVNMTTDLHLDPATSLHLYGTYELHAEIIGGNNFRNFEFDNSSIHTGLYVIEPKSQSGVKAEMITSQSELQQRLAMVEDGKTYKLFLAPGAYGDLILNKNASIEIVGAYFAGTSGIVENISVKFNSITVNSGSLTLDSIRIDAHAVSYNPAGYLSLPGYGLLISSGAGNVSIQRTYFANNNQAIIVNSVAIIMNTGYANKLTVQNSKISGHANGILARSGNLDIENTIIDGNIIGINIAALQSLRLNRNSISHNSEDGLLIYSQITGEVILIVNDFRSNGVAVRTKHNFGATEQEAMLNLSENTFLLNGLNVKLL